MGFTTLGLSDRLLQGVQAAGYTVPTPIQSLAIRPILEGKDLVGCAQTGTGKTAAFVLPMLQRLAEDESGHQRHRHPRALVLTPTRNLHSRYATPSPRTASSSTSAASPSTAAWEWRIRSPVSTEVRTLSSLPRAGCWTTCSAAGHSAVRILVLDEADRMLDMGFIHDVRRIVGTVPKERQTLLFSATVSDDINKLASDILKDPVSVEAGERRTPAETVEQHFYRANARRRSICFSMLSKPKDGERAHLLADKAWSGQDLPPA